MSDGRIDEDVRGGFSARETASLKAFIEMHDLVIAMNFHTYGGKIYLGDLDFTFEKFYAVISEDSFSFEVRDDAPMNLINILSEVEEDIEDEREDVLEADITNFRWSSRISCSKN